MYANVCPFVKFETKRALESSDRSTGRANTDILSMQKVRRSKVVVGDSPSDWKSSYISEYELSETETSFSRPMFLYLSSICFDNVAHEHVGSFSRLPST